MIKKKNLQTRFCVQLESRCNLDSKLCVNATKLSKIGQKISEKIGRGIDNGRVRKVYFRKFQEIYIL